MHQSDFNASAEILENGNTIKYRLTLDGVPISFEDAMQTLITDSPFRAFVIRTLADCEFVAFRWETPDQSNRSCSNPFEFVLVNAPSFVLRKTDSQTYQAYFTDDDSDQGIVTFSSLSKDATLIVPSPRTSPTAYGHLSAFVRNAPQSQVHALFKTIGQEVMSRISETPLWLNTAGGGVAWLHVRVDDRPKYYHYAPYKQAR